MAITTTVQDGKLIITVDISSDVISAAAISKTGKSKIVATTGGFQRLADPQTIRFSLNVIHVDRL
jgi:hypothetical protein